MKKLEGVYEFVKPEEEILKFWDENKTFEKLLEKNKDGKKYRFIDGPITANNPMGIHHAYGRALKDAYLRFKAMNGYTSHYRNGFDSQGLWVEVEVEKELGFKTKKDIEDYGLDNFTNKCVERVKKYSKIQTDQSIRLGQWMDWDNSYYTYKDSNITSIWAFLKKCHDNNWIVKSYRPTPWCPRCGTGLSEHEMTGSYKEVEHIAVFFKVPLLGRDEMALVWTTTPWTLSSNVALAVHPELDYVSVKFKKEDKPLIMAKAVYENRFKKDGGEVLATFKGTELEGVSYETCFPEFEALKDVKHRVVLWDEVSAEDGSGIVHIAPGCGAEDFELGQREKLDVVIPIDDNGIILDGFGFLSGKSAEVVRDEVFEELEKRGKLYFTHPIKHSYPVCWRCKNEILFKVASGWAIDVEELRPKLIENAKKVKWNPAYQEKRMIDWLENMSNWNISRTRYYGLPLPFYNCECGHLTVVGSKEELKDLAVDPKVVDDLPELHRPWIDEVKIRCPHCGKEVSRVPEVGDVWLDAGIVPFSTLKYFEDREYWKSYFPAEYVIEMKEQIRLWFYSLLFMSTVLEGVPPYEQVGTYSTVLSEDGTRFSKTGFMIEFNDAADVIGADVTRYLFAATSTQSDVRFGYSLGDEVKRKLLSYWNMGVFFDTYASIDNPDLSKIKLDINKLDITDKWLVRATDKFITDATKSYNDYDIKTIIDLHEKFVDEVSNYYIRVNRRRFWKSENDDDKLVAYKVLFDAIKKSMQVMAPIIPFMMEHMWQNLILKYEDVEESIHLSTWPEVSGLKVEDEIIEYTKVGRDLITLALRLRNEANIKVRQPLNTLYVVGENVEGAVSALLEVIKKELNVKNVEVLLDSSSLEDKYLSLNFRTAGAVLKGDVNKVKEYLEGLSFEDMEVLTEKIIAGEKVNVLDYELDGEAFVINAKEKEGITLASENGVTAALDMNISEELVNEGLVREFVSKIQQLRKSSDFEVVDRIDITVDGDKEVLNAIKLFEDYIRVETLADSINFEKGIEELAINDYKVLVSLTKK